LAAQVRCVLDSLSSRKDAKPELSWFDEIRAMYPATTIDEDLRRIEIWAEKNNKPFTRDLTLNSLKRHPPRKPGQRSGYLYHNKFINHKEANELALKNWEFLMNAKPAIKYSDGRVEMQSSGPKAK
jgi:hypothetical protein